MHKLFLILLNLLIFFFLISIFDSAFSISGEATIVYKLLVGLAFAVLLSFSSNILKFFKIQINFASLFLVSFVIAFIFFFVALYLLGLIYVNKSVIDFGLPFLVPIELSDRTMALVFLSVVSSFLSVLMQDLSDRR